MLALTFDVDWAPDPIVDEIVSVLDEHGVPSTLFCTNYLRDQSHASSSLRGRYGAQHELGLHPNFQHMAAYSAEWDDMLRLYPDALGWRSHNGVTGWPMISDAFARGLRYEVYPSVFSDYVPPSPVNRALKKYYALTTAFWDSHMLYEPLFSWSASDLPLKHLFSSDSAIVVLGFHPNILYYDMRSVSDYDSRKPSYHVVNERDCFRSRKPIGAMHLLLELLAQVPRKHFTNLRKFGEQMKCW